MVRILGNFDVAEEVVQDSLVAALDKWPDSGIPDNPAAWLMTTARRRAIDVLRRDRKWSEKVALLEHADVAESGSDDRLSLIFTCCHPALAQDAQVALTLRAVAGFTTSEIAAAFLVAEPAMAQRIVRAKRKIVAARIPYRIPEGDELPPRLDAVLAVLYLMFNEGYLSRGGRPGMRRDLAEDALWLCRLLDSLMPAEPEILGLVALMRLNLARSAARFEESGGLILLADQDRGLWDARQIAEGVATLERAAAIGRPGPYQLQAAIAAVHAEARTWEETDWRQIVLLYDALVSFNDSPVVRLNRAVALSHLAGPQVALGEVNDLSMALADYHLFHSTRAELLEQMGEEAQARQARLRALELCQNPAERALLEKKLARRS